MCCVFLAAELDRVNHLKQSVEHKRCELSKIQTRVKNLTGLECGPDELKLLLDAREQADLRRLERYKQALASATCIQDQLRSQLERLKECKPEAPLDEATRRQNDYVHQWNVQRLGTLHLSSDDSRFTLRIEDSSADSFSDRLVVLVRGVKRYDSTGRLILRNLEAVATQRSDASLLADLASAALTPSALIAPLLLNLHVERSLRSDIQRLRDQYALDWDPSKRHLHLLGGSRGEILATLHITSDGAFSLVNLQYKQPDGSNTVDVASTNNRMKTMLNTFTAPVSHSLDEWVSEVHDFCHTLSSSLNL
ncbi:unnamed protein product [Dicrocoelium dendriticum]|nr:unnamed protein product [Dicrocoelium dendriticum]